MVVFRQLTTEATMYESVRARIQAELDEIDNAGLHKDERVLQSPQGRRVKVGDAEYLDLTRQGLIFDGEPEGEPEENGAGKSGDDTESTEG